MSTPLELTAEIVGAFVVSNPKTASSLPDLIETVNKSLNTLNTETVEPAPVTAVNPKCSIHSD